MIACFNFFKATRMQVISPNCCGAKVTPQNAKLNDLPQVGDGRSEIQPVPPLFGDGYDLGGMCLGLGGSPDISEDPASLEANVKDVQQDPYRFQSPPPRQPIFSPRGGFPTPLQAPH